MSGTHRDAIRTARSVVVKIGTTALTTESGLFDAGRLAQLADAIESRMKAGSDVVIVSSGAIAAGIEPLGLSRRPTDLATKQAAASVGQVALVNAWSSAFGRYHRTVGQVLLTAHDISMRVQHTNAQRTLDRLRALHAVAIVNENDTVATNEIRFGDNDRLSALVAHLVGADALEALAAIAAIEIEAPLIAAITRAIEEERAKRAAEAAEAAQPVEEPQAAAPAAQPVEEPGPSWDCRLPGGPGARAGRPAAPRGPAPAGYAGPLRPAVAASTIQQTARAWGPPPGLSPWRGPMSEQSPSMYTIRNRRDRYETRTEGVEVDAAEELRLVRIFQDPASPQAERDAALERLTYAHYRYVAKVANAYCLAAGIETADLITAGWLGYLRALQKFDPSRGLRVLTYAGPWIRQSCGRAVDMCETDRKSVV